MATGLARPATIAAPSVAPRALSGRPVVSVAPIRIATPRLLSASAAAGVAEAGAVQQEAYAVYRYVKGSPNKVRRVLDQIRGLSYEEALMILEYMPYRACEPVLKCLVSAAANAKNNYDMKKSSLYVSTAFADMGPKMKRFRCGDRGRPKAYNKALSHITIKVAERDSTELN